MFNIGNQVRLITNKTPNITIKTPKTIHHSKTPYIYRVFNRLSTTIPNNIPLFNTF